MQSDNPENLNLLFYNFNKPENPQNIKRASQILEATEGDEDDEDYTIERQFPDIGNMDHMENSFDKRKNIDNMSMIPMKAEEIIRGMRSKDTPVTNKYFIKPKDIGHSTMINWAKKDRLPSRGIHTRGGRRRERIAK
jgi:hypothetical protein